MKQKRGSFSTKLSSYKKQAPPKDMPTDPDITENLHRNRKLITDMVLAAASTQLSPQPLPPSLTSVPLFALGSLSFNSFPSHDLPFLFCQL